VQHEKLKNNAELAKSTDTAGKVGIDPRDVSLPYEHRREVPKSGGITTTLDFGISSTPSLEPPYYFETTFSKEQTVKEILWEFVDDVRYEVGVFYVLLIKRWWYTYLFKYFHRPYLEGEVFPKVRA